MNRNKKRSLYRFTKSLVLSICSAIMRYDFHAVRWIIGLILTIINWQPLCSGQCGKYGILIGSEALTTGFIQTGIDISVTTMMVASYVNKQK